MAEQLNAAARYRKRGEYASRVIAGETIVVPVRGQMGDLESIYNLNEVGSVIWELLDGRTTVGGMIDEVCLRFDVDREQAERDTLEFLAGLETAGLVETA